MASKFLISQGGIGDALLGLAASYRHGKCRIVHAAGQMGTAKIVERMFRCFEVPEFDVLPRSFTVEEFCILKYSQNCLPDTYLPDNLDYKDWAHFGKYKSRVATTMPVQSLFGKAENPCDTYKVVTVAPTGSNSPRTIVAPWGDVTKERYISRSEYERLVEMLAADCTVYVVGSEKDRENYGLPAHPHCFWLTFDETTSGDGTFVQSTMKQLFARINSSDLVISADTWVKTYSCMACVPTVVTKTRYDGHYHDFREVHDWGENVFLNPDLWNIDIRRIEDLLQGDELRAKLGFLSPRKTVRYF